jgi:hypothetical protein
MSVEPGMLDANVLAYTGRSEGLRGDECVDRDPPTRFCKKPDYERDGETWRAPEFVLLDRLNVSVKKMPPLRPVATANPESKI